MPKFLFRKSLSQHGWLSYHFDDHSFLIGAVPGPLLKKKNKGLRICQKYKKKKQMFLDFTTLEKTIR